MAPSQKDIPLMVEEKGVKENNNRDSSLRHDYPTKTTACHIVALYLVIASRSRQAIKD